MEGIKAAAEAVEVTVTVHRIDWVDDELVAELGTAVRRSRAEGWDDGFTELELQSLTAESVRNACKELFEREIDRDRINSYLEVKLESLYGPGGGWPVVTVTGPIVLVDRLMEVYFETERALADLVDPRD